MIAPAALLVLTLAAAWPSQDGAAFYREGVDALQRRDYGLALERYERAVEADPDSLKFGSEYRMAAIQAREFDRAISLFEKLALEHPESSQTFLNLGFAYVDKVPEAGSITRVLLANTALKHFTRSVEIRPSWIGYFTRGNSYLFWPEVFNRVPLGIADLNQAMEIQKRTRRRSHQQRTFLSLGDGHYKMDDLEAARRVWTEGLAAFPSSKPLRDRLSAGEEALAKLIETQYDPRVRVDTNLKALWIEE